MTMKSSARNAPAAIGFNVKSFGRRQAYESRRGTNPRGPGETYGDFDFRLVLGLVRPALACTGADADGLSSAGIAPLFRCSRPALKPDRAAIKGGGASCRVARNAGAA